MNRYGPITINKRQFFLPVASYFGMKDYIIVTSRSVRSANLELRISCRQTISRNVIGIRQVEHIIGQLQHVVVNY